MKRYAVAALIAGSVLRPASNLRAQDAGNEVRTRQLWDTNLLKQRAQASHKPGASSKAVPATGDNLIGVTLWRYRSSRPQDAPAVRMLVHEPDTGKDEDFTPERCEADTALQVGQKVRLSIESARTGFLYVVDRERYADGSFGDAELIFPTQRTHRGDNRVQAGQLIDIPANGEGLFTIERRRKDLIAEELTVLVSPQPIAGLSIGPKALPVTKEQLAEWRKNWGATVKQLEEPGQAGNKLTAAEKQAAEKGAPLTDADALPQTMFQVQARPGSPLMVTVPLKIQGN
jgi:hypothetical protein